MANINASWIMTGDGHPLKTDVAGVTVNIATEVFA